MGGTSTVTKRPGGDDTMYGLVCDTSSILRIPGRKVAVNAVESSMFVCTQPRAAPACQLCYEYHV